MLIAEAFAALLALEEGTAGREAGPVDDRRRPPPPAAEPRITDAVVEESCAERVIQRLAPDAVRAVVVDVVSEIAERLVKEEIARIRKQHA